METPQEREARLLPGGEPRYVRLFDNFHRGDLADRFLVTFNGRYPDKPTGGCLYLIASVHPMIPGGTARMMENEEEIIGAPGSPGHPGRARHFYDFPPTVRGVIIAEYRRIWMLDDWNDDALVKADWTYAPNFVARRNARTS